MTIDIDELSKAVLSASRKGLFRRKPIFRPHAPASSEGLNTLEKEIGAPLPADLRKWLLALGYGDIDETLSFRKEWFACIERGELKGGALFAQDILGNFYAYDTSGRIVFLSRSEPVFAAMSLGFLEFIEELVRRDYKLEEWVSTLKAQKYDW